MIKKITLSRILFSIVVFFLLTSVSFSQNANLVISGNANPNTYSEISNEIKNGVDYIVNLSREKKCGNPSTIIKIGLDNVVKIIRK